MGGGWWPRQGEGRVPRATGCARRPTRRCDSLGVVEGAKVWDLFAGSGAMGIEALCRGVRRTSLSWNRGVGRLGRPGQLGQARLWTGPGHRRVWRCRQLGYLTSRSRRGSATCGGPAGAVDRGGPAGGATKAEQEWTWSRPTHPMPGRAGHPARLPGPTRAAGPGRDGRGARPAPGWQALRSKRYGGTLLLWPVHRDRATRTDRSDDGPDSGVTMARLRGEDPVRTP